MTMMTLPMSVIWMTLSAKPSALHPGSQLLSTLISLVAQSTSTTTSLALHFSLHSPPSPPPSPLLLLLLLLGSPSEIQEFSLIYIYMYIYIYIYTSSSFSPNGGCLVINFSLSLFIIYQLNLRSDWSPDPEDARPLPSSQFGSLYPDPFSQPLVFGCRGTDHVP